MKPSYLPESRHDLLRFVAEYYLPREYYFFALGLIPEFEEPGLIDRQILDKIEAAKWTSHGKWSNDSAVYLRWERYFHIWSKDWRHPVFVGLEGYKGDVRLHPCVLCDYEIRAVQSRNGKYRARIRINDFFYDILNDKATRYGTNFGPEEIANLFSSYVSAPFPLVHDQLVALLRTVNKKRDEAGLERVHRSAVGLENAAAQPLKRKRH